MAKAEQLEIALSEQVEGNVDPCYCCTEQATHDVAGRAGWGMRIDLCDDCAGAGFERIKGEYVFVCPAHGARLALEIVDVQEGQFRKTRAGKTVLFCEHGTRKG